MKAWLQIAGAFFGIIAAVLWWYASYQTVLAHPKPFKGGYWFPPLVKPKPGSPYAVDVIGTAEKQSKWNAGAAFVTGFIQPRARRCRCSFSKNQRDEFA